MPNSQSSFAIGDPHPESVEANISTFVESDFNLLNLTLNFEANRDPQITFMAIAQMNFAQATMTVQYLKEGKQKPKLEITKATLFLEDLSDKERSLLALRIKERIKASISTQITKELLLIKREIT